MTYQYECDCGEKIDREFPMGKALQSIKCKCGKKCYRSYKLTVSVPESTHISREGRGRG